MKPSLRFGISLWCLVLQTFEIQSNKVVLDPIKPHPNQQVLILEILHMLCIDLYSTHGMILKPTNLNLVIHFGDMPQRVSIAARS